MEKIDDLLVQIDDSLTREYLSGNKPEGSILTSYANGNPGVAMFYAYYYLRSGKQAHLDKCHQLIEEALDFISEESAIFTFCNGLAGTGWVIQHLIDIGLVDADADILDAFDELLFDYGVGELRAGSYDFLHNGLGGAVYFLGRPNNRKYLEPMIEALEATSRSDEHGIYWQDYLSARYDDGAPRVNFGMAHGMGSIIFFLAKCVEQEIMIEKASSMLKSALNYILHYSDLNTYVGSYFPTLHYFKEPKEKTKSRLAWCYGDPGIGYAFIMASKALKDPAMEQRVTRLLMESTSRRDRHEASLIDGGVCHGLAGISFIYRQLNEVTEQSEFLEAGSYWLDHLYEYIDWCGGVEAFQEFDGKSKQFKKSMGFLTGLTGVGLVLLDWAEKPKNPGWSRFLLMN